jgi:hypothetical protein
MTQVCFRVQPVQSGRPDQTIKDGRPLATVIRAGEQIVAASYGYRTKRTFGDKVVELDAAIIEIA